ncbi:hypothetical protein, partial [Leptospira stimsonii]|uniref:hypothetical protein n=1 Tax=Leptospira stimsonii TaxID=2202203 RepID=UPI003CCFE9FA
GSRRSEEILKNFHSSTPVSFGGMGYALKDSRSNTKNWLNEVLKEKQFVPLENEKPDPKFSSKSALNQDTVIKKSPKGLAKELRAYNAFWNNKGISHQKKHRELNHQKLAFKIWNHIQSNQSDANYTVEEICTDLKVHKKSVLKIFRKWIRFRFILRRIIYNLITLGSKVDFQVIPNCKELPYLLYSNPRNQKYRIQFNKKGNVTYDNKV